MPSIHWFRNDLRLDDNPALQEALEDGEVLPVFVLDPRLWGEDRWGHVKTGPFRTQFLWESLQDLRLELEARGGVLLVREGLPEEVLPALMKEHGCGRVTAQAEHTPEELEAERLVRQAVEEAGGAFACLEGLTLYHPEDLPMPLASLPDIFTQFRKKMEKGSEVREPIPAPLKVPAPKGAASDNVPSLQGFLKQHGMVMPVADSRAVLPFQGGASAARARLKHYFWDSKRLAVYKKTRNGLVGADYSSKFSPWLANGCISARRIASEVRRFEREVESNDSTYWLVFELIWRDYFRFVAMKYGTQMFHRKALKPDSPNRGTQRHPFEAWKEGRTQDAFVNANMRELSQTGFMSNRGRQNVASYLVHDLGIDWRLGASWFEHMLLDHDPASNTGNWIYVAGVGNDPRPNRSFNTRRQAEMYDANGTYQTLWSTHAMELDIR